MIVEWSSGINEQALHQTLGLQDQIRKDKIAGVLESWTAYGSLAIHYNSDLIGFEELRKTIETLQNQPLQVRTTNRWLVPVCYETEYSPDLTFISKELRLSEKEVISLHSSNDYTVHFIGFLPGFMYLSGLDEKLHFSRKENPELKVPKGAVGIGGSQTGIYPMESPGGWHIIGSSPLDFFDAENKIPCFIQPGDTVRFNPVSKQEYKVTKLAIDLKVFDLNEILKNG